MRLNAALTLLLATGWAKEAVSVLCSSNSEATQRRNIHGQVRGQTGGSRKKSRAKRFARVHGRRMRRGR